MAKVDVGDAAPDFELPGTGGKTYRLSDYRGGNVVLAFYPGDATTVCTAQFCSYRDNADRLDQLDAEVLGISPQSVDSHERWAQEQGLNVPLLADEDLAVAKRYGSTGWLGRSPGSPSSVKPGGCYVMRSIFIVDGEGIDPLPARLADRRSATRRSATSSGPSPQSADGERRAGPFEAGDGLTIRGERAGEGPPIVLCHGITATRRYVVHGSRALERAGHTRHHLRRARPRRVRPGPGRPGLWIPGAGRRPRVGGGGDGRRGPLRARRPLDGRPHGRRLRAPPSRAPGRRWW